MFASEKKTTLWSLALVELEEWKAVQQREIWKSRHIQAMKARTIDCEILAHQKPLMENSISKKPPSRIPLISVSVAFCQFLPPSISLRCTTKPRGRKKVVVTWSICSQPCTICNISMRSFFTSQVWPPKLEEMQAMPPNSSQQHPVVKFREIGRYQSNLNLISCHAGQRQIPWRLSNVSLEALQGLKVHLFAWTRTLRIYEVSIGRLIDFQIHGVLFKQADLKPLFFCGKSPSSVRDWCLAMWIVILLATQSQSNLRP